MTSPKSLLWGTVAVVLFIAFVVLADGIGRQLGEAIAQALGPLR
jgi:hypothetical protein